MEGGDLARPGSCRVAEEPGLYLARPMALDPDGLAADAHAGIQAALLVSADAGRG